MPDEKMKLPGMERVNIVGGRYPKLMEIADSAIFIERLTKEEFLRVVEVSIKYQSKLIELEMGALKAQAEALVEVQKVIKGFKG